MEIDHCLFPDDLLYDVENNTWLRIEDKTRVRIGVTSLLSALAGRFVRANLKSSVLEISRAQSLGTLESERLVGPVPSPVSGVLLETNQRVVDRPRTVNDSSYGDGWIARLEPSKFDAERTRLSSSADAKVLLAQKIAQFRVRCFKAFPDREMFEIGTECSAVLVRLNDQIASMPVGEVVHLVSDDPTAYVEMVAWADRTKQDFVDWRKEGRLFHFIVRKVR